MPPVSAWLGAGYWGWHRLRAQQRPGSRSRSRAPATRWATITIKFVGTANVNEQVVRANMQLHEGGDLDDTMLDRDIRNLYKTGLFEFIQTKWEAAGPRTFNLVVEVTPKFRVLAVRYEGNKKVKTSRLEKEVKTKPNTALDERQVKEDSEKIHEYYQKQGYNQVSVTYMVERNRATGFGTVIFQHPRGQPGEDRRRALHRQRCTSRRRPCAGRWTRAAGGCSRGSRTRAASRTTPSTTTWASCATTTASTAISTWRSPRTRSSSTTRSRQSSFSRSRSSEGRLYHIGQISFSGNKLHSSALLGRVVRQKTGRHLRAVQARRRHRAAGGLLRQGRLRRDEREARSASRTSRRATSTSSTWSTRATSTTSSRSWSRATRRRRAR